LTDLSTTHCQCFTRLITGPNSISSHVPDTFSRAFSVPHRVFQPELRHPCPDRSLRPVRPASSYGILDFFCFFLGPRLSGIIATARRRATGSRYSLAFRLSTGGRQRCSRATPPPSTLSLHVDGIALCDHPPIATLRVPLRAGGWEIAWDAICRDCA
jgi:hypothetical protein